ncbi:ABC transporter substrate-binding protein [Streptomyces sp. BI20]|uniref:ABC transporter substrate-binding protein n=1 Tax=Streptomyces sp. BI20 TaxID=3403460 RepID=UPI003C7905FD
MFNRTRSLQSSAVLASISLLAGCGLISGGEDDKPIVVGTTSAPSTLDPAAAYDGSWELYRNVFQTLLAFPSGAVTPQPDAAESCKFTDSGNQSFRCVLRKGLEFSDGEPLDAAAVKHSFDRIRAINSNTGPSGLFANLDKVEAPDARTVVFHLTAADATFPFVLGSPAASLVPPKLYPASALRTDGKVTGSGPYTLESYQKDKESVLARNEGYNGFAKDRKNAKVTIRYFASSEKMVKALKAKEIDVTYRGLTSPQVKDLQSPASVKDGIQTVEAFNADIRYLVFSGKDPVTAKPAVRQAIAQLVDRGNLVAKVYKGTAEPLFSMVPKGIVGHRTPFYDVYGHASLEKARQILAKDNITTPVPLTFWYTTDRYGDSTRLEFEELKRQLEAGGLFRITIEGKPWTEFHEAYSKGEYAVFGRGWFPDFPDPENFIAPFVGAKNQLGTPYLVPEITDVLLPKSRRQSDRATVGDEMDKAQQIIAKDARLLPLWQGKLYVASREDIGGGERALDPQTAMQMWELYRKESW